MNTQLIVLIASVAVNFVLSVLIFLHLRGSQSGKYLFWIMASLSGWIVFNHLSNLDVSYGLMLWFNKMIFLTSSVIGWSFALFADVFPNDVAPKRKARILMLGMLLAVMAISVSPFLVESVVPGEEVSEVIFGPGIAIYATYILGCLVYAISKIFGKYRKNKGKRERKIFRLLMMGIGIFVFFAVATNLLVPILFGFFGLTVLAPLYTSLFGAIIFYAIIRYRLLNIKIITTELFIFGLWGFLVVQVIISEALYTKIINSSILIPVVILGISLIQSVRAEVKRKEELQDITNQLALANEQLKKLDKAKSEFISIASHQLRTPLTAIKGFVSLVQEGIYGEVSPKINEVLGKVYQANERLIALVEDLLNVSRIESGRMEYTYSDEQIEDIIKELIDNFTIESKRRGLRLESALPENLLPKIKVDKTKIREVISNLIDNALKYTKEGSVTVGAEKRGKALRITVSDTGAGIAPETLPHLFTKFTRGTKTKLMHTGGSGLGLYVGRKMIEAQGGKIWAESEGEGKGSRFIIEMPTV